MNETPNRGWQEVLRLAARDPSVAEHLGPLVTILEAALAGTATIEAIATLFDDEYLVHPRFLVELDASFSSLEGEGLFAAQAALAALPLVMEELVALKLGYAIRPEVVQEFLDALVASFERARNAVTASNAPLKCPRCAATDVRLQEAGTDVNGALFVVATCALCGLTEEWQVEEPSRDWLP